MLFSRKKVTASIEGTQGKYVKRESPPSVPSLSATSVGRTRRSPMSASSLLLDNQDESQEIAEDATAAEPSGSQNDIDEIEDEEYDIYKSIDAIFENKEKDFVCLPSRSTVSENDVYSESNEEPSTSFGMRNNNVLSSRSFNRGALRYVPRKSLTTSHSIGNVEQGLKDLSIRDDDMTAGHQPRFQSLQTLPSEQIMTIQQYRTSCDLGATPDLPLPENWAIEYTSENQMYYVDHANRRTHWVHPLVNESLKPGWKKCFNPQKGVFYYNESLQKTQFEHPGISNPIFRTESVNVANRSTMDLNANLHIIEEKELPPWLLMYAQSDSSLDHLLEWELFDLKQLKEYEHIMLKLYKQEVIDIVRKYEKRRNVLNREIHRRDISRPPPPRN
ncbi:unnamed protein product [Caenorhabditis bovis]|uniref:Uncharacterized protein n=1 Tax=Caenorhabditis bovis TaxID=2654633 RepID=A0A8S1EIJ6_9PELO|nr:unnamed protein product [Caenorhabditis bovis]